MKKMKNLFLTLALMIGLTYFMPVISGFKNIANAAPNGVPFKYLSIQSFEETANVGSNYYIAEGVVLEFDGIDTYSQSTETVSVTVKSPVGATLAVQNDVDGDYVAVNRMGTYSVVYSYTDDNTSEVFSHTLKFKAVEGVYSFEFEENSQYIIPSNVKTTSDKKVVLPNPTVLNEDGEEILGADVEIRVLTPTLTELTAPELVEVNGHYEFLANVEGNWTVEYLYKSGNRVLASTTRTISSTNSFVNEYTLTFVYNATVPTAAVTGVETTLPSVTARNANGNQVSSYYTINVKRAVYNSQTGLLESATDVTEDVISENNIFTPNQDGDYIITYTVKDFYNNTASVSSFEIRGVKDTQAPVVKIVKPYTETPVDYDASYDIPTKTYVDNFVLPAIWAEDNVNSIGELTLTRKIVRTNGDVVYEGTTSASKELVFNYNSGSYTIDTNTQEEVLIDSLTAGTYNITYIAKDSSGNESTSATYRVVIEAGFIDDVNPTITWSTTQVLPGTRKAGDVLTFPAPTVSDNVHTRVRTVVEYFFYDGVEPLEEDWTVLELEDGVYTLEILNKSELRLRATAYDAHTNSTTITATVDIIDTNDTKELKMLSVTDLSGLNTFIQGNELTLNTVEFEDDYINYVSVDIFATVMVNGKQVKLDAYNALVDAEIGGGLEDDVISVSDAKLLASFEGDYTFTFVAKDLQNNYAIFFYTESIAPFTEQTEIAFTKLPASLNGGKLELGQSIDLPQAELTGPQSATKSYIVRLINSPSGAIINSNVFTPSKIGIYTIEYYGTVNDGFTIENVSKTFTVEVQDTTAPVIEDIYIQPVVELGYSLQLDAFIASDISEIDAENSKVTVTSKSLGSRTFYYGENVSLTLSYNQVYTLTFTAKDIHGNTSTTTKTIKVGDTDAPILEVEEGIVPTTATVGQKLTIDLSKITVSDIVDTALSVEDVVITVTRDGETIVNNHGDSTTDYEFNLSQAGQYTVTFKVTDANGNESITVTKTVSVTASPNSGLETTEVLGIVLIVVSVLILAGAVVYFVISKKKADQYKA